MQFVIVLDDEGGGEGRTEDGEWNIQPRCL